MKRKFKKFMAAVLTLTIFMTASVPAFAGNNVQQEVSGYDVYESELIECVNVSGIDYTYQYYYDDEGNRTINVIDGQTNELTVVKYDEATSQVYADGNVIATVEPVHLIKVEEASMLSAQSDDSWVHLAGPDSYRITWAKGTAGGMVAAAIAAGVGSVLTSSYIVGIMGAAALAYLGQSCTGGTITMTVYKWNSNIIHQYKYVWSFLASTGDNYGPFEYITNPNPYV